RRTFPQPTRSGGTGLGARITSGPGGKVGRDEGRQPSLGKSGGWRIEPLQWRITSLLVWRRWGQFLRKSGRTGGSLYSGKPAVKTASQFLMNNPTGLPSPRPDRQLRSLRRMGGSGAAPAFDQLKDFGDQLVGYGHHSGVAGFQGGLEL